MNTESNPEIAQPVKSYPKRKVWMKTYGCQMNYHDSERVMDHLGELNFTPTEDQNEADLILFNTCSIRDLANQKFYSHLGETKRIKEAKGEKVVIGVGGCIAQVEGKELVKKYRHLDFAFGTDVIDQIGDFVFRSFSGDSKFAVNTWDRSTNYSIETKITHDEPRAFVNIIKGCNKVCSYCIVPFTRGKERSRKVSEVRDDIKKLVEHRGVQEITLLGQNVNSFGKDNGETLTELVGELEKVNGLHVLRYTTSHPYDVSDELIAAHGWSTKLAPHLHLPVQSGSTTVLKRMRREYTKDHYLGLLEKLRASKPGIVVSSDIIVGFPNETDDEFADTIDLLNRAEFDFIYSYTYSERKGTRASRMDDTLTDKIKSERLQFLQKHQLEIQKNLRTQMVGKRYLVWVDGDSNMGGVYKLKGRTPCYRIVHFEPPVSGGELKDFKWHWMEVEVSGATALSAQAKVIKDWGINPPTIH